LLANWGGRNHSRFTREGVSAQPVLLFTAGDPSLLSESIKLQREFDIRFEHQKPLGDAVPQVIAGEKPD
jgi:hypothetical protein